MTKALVRAIGAPIRAFEELASNTQDRLVGAVLALPTGTVLGLAASLTPDPSGMGTHRQLGLGGCSMLVTTGVPCPMCGMTTTFAHLAHLHLLDALKTQPFGVVLFTLTAMTFLVGASDLLLPARRWRRALSWIEPREGWIAGGLMVGLGLGWAYKVLTAGAILSRIP